MMKVPALPYSSSGARGAKTTPLTGVMIGTGISLLMWAMILGIVVAVR